MKKITIIIEDEEKQKPRHIIAVNDKKFWEIVKKVDWGTNCTKPKYYKEVCKNLLEEYGEETLGILYNKCRSFSQNLQEQLFRYSKENYKSWRWFCEECGFEYELSSDSTWYLCTFIVGCGEEAYDKVMLNPTQISEFKDYTEGFSYCFIK